MKKTFWLWMLLASIPATLCAQSKDKTFEVPEYIIFNRKFTINFDNGNKLAIWVSDVNDLQQLTNLDSLVQVFLKDIDPLKDSLANELSAKSINYFTDKQNRKKIRLLQYPPIGSSFFVDRGGIAALKTVQDTIYMVGILPDPPRPADNTSLKHPRYYSLTFYLNDWSDVRNYINGGLNAKIKTLLTNINGKWVKVKGTGTHRLQADNDITAFQSRGYGAGYSFLAGHITVNAQNYKQYFVPSFSLGLRATLTNKERSYKWMPGVLWEPHFFFSKDAQGNLKTHRNDFLMLVYAQGGTTDRDPRKEFSFSTHVSFGYLVHRSGDYFDKNSFRLGGGQIQLKKTTIEPCMYFNNFFKGVSPAIKISQSF
jgi:hypothetical protein